MKRKETMPYTMTGLSIDEFTDEHRSICERMIDWTVKGYFIKKGKFKKVHSYVDRIEAEVCEGVPQVTVYREMVVS